MEITSASYQNKRKLQFVLGLTLTYLIAEIIGGLITKSLALLADAGHMFTDVGGLALALFAIKVASRPSSPQKTYGYYRAEILASLANAVVLIGISIYILYEAYKRFISPPEVQSQAMLVVAGIGLVINIIGMMILRKSTSQSLNMKGAYFEVLSDMLTSIGVMIAGIVMLTTGWYYADPLISAAIGLLILPRTWRLLMEAVNVLLEGTPKDVNIADLQKAMEQVSGVKAIHDMHVWSLTSGVNAVSAHVRVGYSEDYNVALKALADKVTTDFKISHTTFQIETDGYSEQENNL
ncbi:MAG: cation diffusion facilitator family transporter [Chitinophagaceae bacterium]|nr:cation diffusion facilitator family transporter [Chitinophagaceae bacterium]